MLTYGHHTPLTLKARVLPLLMRSASLPILLKTEVSKHLYEFSGRNRPFAKPHTRPLLTRPGKIALLLPQRPILSGLLLVMPP